MKSKKISKEQKLWREKYPSGKATLDWNIIDYNIWQIDPPECLISDNSLTEGEQMSDKDIETWFSDTVKTLKTVKETEPEIFKRLYEGLILDIKYLISINKLGKSTLNFVLDKDNFQFDSTKEYKK